MYRIIALIFFTSLNGFSLDEAEHYREEVPVVLPTEAPVGDARAKNASDDRSDQFANRPDVAGFKKEPVVFFLPFWKELTAVHPKTEADDTDKNVIVLDLDELAASGSAGNSSGAEIGESVLLLGSGVLAFWFGTRTSIMVIIGTTEEIKELKEQKKALLDVMGKAMNKDISSLEKRRIFENVVALLNDNKQNQGLAQYERAMMGVVPAIGATSTGVSAVLQVPVYATASMAAAGALGMAISGPIISLFSAAAAAKHGYKFYQTFAAMNEANRRLTTASPEESVAYNLLKERLNLIRTISATTGSSMIGLTIGVPLTIFGGPIGLVFLVPGAVGGIAGSYFNGRKVNYAPQLSWEDIVALDGHDGLINDIVATHATYSLLKKMKSEQRLLYPIGKNAPFPFKTFATGIASLKRMTNGTSGYLSAEETFFSFLKQSYALDIEAAAINKNQIDKKFIDFSSRYVDRGQMSADDLMIESDYLEKLKKYDADLRGLKLEETLLNRALTTPLSDDESVFLLVRYMVKNQLFLPFAEGIMSKKSLKKMIKYTGAITKDGEEYHVNANKLVTLMLRDSVLAEPVRKKLREKLFKLGRDILFITAKNRIQWRERQLLDFLATRITHSEA